MTETNARVLEALAGCQSNGVNLEDLVREFFNVAEASVDAEGDIAVGQTWLDEPAKREFLAWLETA